MSFDNPEKALPVGRVPSVTRSRPSLALGLGEWLHAAAFSLWGRRGRPPDVPAYLRADLGLPPDYEAKTFEDVTFKSYLRRRFDHE